MAAPLQIVLLLLLFLHASPILANNAHQDFDVRRHLSTVTRYHVAKDISENSFVPSDIPDQCKPIHLNLVARHGTRAPTKKKMKELDALSTRLEVILGNVKEQKSFPAWLKGWKSPWTGKHKGGELISEGESELYELGVRVREKFPQLFREDDHPDIYPIKATQVSRASASAVAFGMGLLSDRGNLGPGRHRAFSVISESRASDVMLRFHDCCQNYKPEIPKLAFKLQFMEAQSNLRTYLKASEAIVLELCTSAPSVGLGYDEKIYCQPLLKYFGVINLFIVLLRT